MKHSFLLRFCVISTLFIGLYSCGNKKEEFTTEPLSDYFPLEKGKYITYRLDSLVFVDFEKEREIHRYQVKHVVDEIVMDNEGRPSYRIYRWIRDSAGTSEWQANGSYYITPLEDQIEVIEDNLRFIKLHEPFRDGFNWKGNQYLPGDAYESFGYAFSNDNSMRNWDFTYNLFDTYWEYQGYEYNDVYTVEEEDYADNVAEDGHIFSPTQYANRTKAVERYGKDIGLVYREYELWEYQPTTRPEPFYIGFGIRMWMIDHN
jgi:hypothetical protein